MKRCFLAILLFVGFVLLVAVAALKSHGLQEALGRLATARLEQLLGPEVHVERVRVGLLPLRVDLEGVAMNQFFHAKRVRAYLNLIPLWFHEVSLVRVVVDGLDLQAVRSAEGAWNLQALLDRLRERLRHRRGGGYRVALRELSFRNARLRLTDARSGISASVSGLSAQTNLLYLARRDIWVRYEGRRLELRFPKGPPVSGRMDGFLRLDRRGIHLKRVHVEAGDSRLTLQGTVSLDPPHPASLTATGSLSIPLLADLAGLPGENKGALRFAAAAGGPFPRLTGEVHFAIEDGRLRGMDVSTLDARMEISRETLTLAQLTAAIAGGSMDASGTLRLKARPLSYHYQAKISNVRLGGILQDFPALLPLAEGRVSLQVSGSGRGLGLTSQEAQGILRYAKGGSVAPQPHPLAGGLGLLQGAECRFRVAKGEVVVEPLRIWSGQTHVETRGRLGMQGKMRLDFQLTSSHLGELTSPFIRKKRFRGNALLTGVVDGHWQDPMLRAHMRIWDAAVQGVPVEEATAVVSIRGRALRVEKLRLIQGDSHYEGEGEARLAKEQGRWKPSFKANLQVRQGDPGAVVAIFYKPLPLSMRVDGEMTIQGTLQNFVGEGTLSVGAGRAYGQAFDHGTVRAKLTRTGMRFHRAEAVRNKGRVVATGWIDWEKKAFEAQGTATHFDLAHVNLLQSLGLRVSGRGRLAVNAGGSLKRPQVQAHLEAPAVSHRNVSLGPVQARLWLDGHQIRTETQLPALGTEIAASAWIDPLETWKIESQWSPGRLTALFSALSPALAGRMAATATGSLTLEGWGLDPDRLAGNLSLSRLTVELGKYAVRAEGGVSLRLRGRRLTVDRVSWVGDGTALTVGGYLDLFRSYRLHAEGHTDLRLLRLFTAALDHSGGRADLTLTLNGSWNDPQVGGILTLKDGVLKVRELPQRLSEVHGSLHLERNKLILDGLEGTFGDGKVSIDGRASLDGLRLSTFALGLRLGGVRLRPRPELSLTLNGDLVYQGRAQKQTLSGEIQILQGRYTRRLDWKTRLLQLRAPRKRVSRPVPLVGDTVLNVRLSGKDRLWIDNNILRLPVWADVLIQGTVNHPVILGRVESREGRLYFRGREFLIRSATVDFVDPGRTYPVLDIQAQASMQGYDIRLSLAGDLERLQLELFATPPLTDMEILALLTQGKVPRELVGREGGVAAGEAVSFLTGKLQDAIEQRVSKIAGFDRFQVSPYVTTSGPAGGPRVTVGKTLMEGRLSVTYSGNIGTTEEQVLRMEYRLTPSISLVGERDEQGQIGGDVWYRYRFW